MVKVLRHGRATNPPKVIFKCESCSCIFEANEDDFSKVTSKKSPHSFISTCPECHCISYDVDELAQFIYGDNE